MAISLKAVGSWIDLTTTSVCSIPGSPAAGDRMILVISWKDYTVVPTAPSGWTAIGSIYADGTDSAGTGSGSMSVWAWYRDWQSGDANPTVGGLAGVEGGSAVVYLWQKASGETWSTPLTSNGPWTFLSAQTVSALASLAVPDGAVVIGVLGLSDDVGTITRGTTDIAGSGITWNGNYVESPATHWSSSSELDSSVDAGYRLVTTGATATLELSALLGTAETGAVQFIVQGVTGSAAVGTFFPWFMD